MKTVGYGETFKISNNEPVYTSGVVSRLLGIPVWILKQLDKEAIVSPQRKKGKSRLYSKQELDKLSHIWYIMKEKGVKIKSLKYILEIEKKVFKRKK